MRVVKDFIRYMNTTTPKGVDHKRFIQLKYDNRDKLDLLQQVHPEVDEYLLTKVAVRDFLEKSDEDIMKELGEYAEV